MFTTLAINGNRLRKLAKRKQSLCLDEFSEPAETILALLDRSSGVARFIRSSSASVDALAIEDCEHCGHLCFAGQVLETRVANGDGLLRRRKECDRCAEKTTMYEVRRDELLGLMSVDVDWDDVDAKMAEIRDTIDMAKQRASSVREF